MIIGRLRRMRGEITCRERIPMFASRYNTALLCSLLALAAGCRSNQYARVIRPGDKEMIGSHQAGQETFRPLTEEAVAKLLARHCPAPAQIQTVSAGIEQLPPPKATVCFVGVENKTAEEIGDFKELLFESIEAKISESGQFTTINRRYVEAGLQQLRLRPDQLFIPGAQAQFAGVMQTQGQPFEYLMFAKLTSGTTRQNKDYQRDYLLTLELVDIRNGQQDKQSAEISKGYHHSWTSRAMSNLPFGTKYQ
jgi:Peptidoglycan-synthase activator LpoB